MTLPFYSSTQNLPENIELLKASNVAYNNAKSNEFKFSYVFLTLGILYPIAYIVLQNENAKHGLFAVSLCLTVLYQLFSNWFKGNTTMGALLKEEFDLNVFGLPRKFMLAELEPVDVGRMAEKYKGTEIKDWYSTNISGAISKNTTIAICQRVNCKWDSDLRKEFNKLLITFVISHFLLMMVLGFLVIQNFMTTFLLMFSLASVYTHFITMIRGNYSAINKREKIITKLDSYINHKKEFLTENLRDVQDEILNARQEPAKVPDFYFKKYNPKFQQDHEKYIERVNKIYA
jgi:hypothetical protein